MQPTRLPLQLMPAIVNEKFAEDIRDAVKALMEADPYYLDLPILTERLQDLDAKIDETIQLTEGIAVILVVVELAEPLPNLAGANFGDIKLVARTIENLNLNTTGKGAQEVSIHTAALWSQLKPDALTAPLKLTGVTLGNDPRGLTFDCSASTAGGTQIEIPRLEPIASEIIPNARGRLDGFSDGTRDYLWRVQNGRYVEAGKTGAEQDVFLADATAASDSSYEQLVIIQQIGGAFGGSWIFEQIDGVWTNTSFEGETTATAPIIAGDLEFFPDPVVALLPHPTPGAAIFVTLDGSQPIPRNPAAEIYAAAAPFDAPSGTTLRARAWLPGYIPSAELRAVL